MEWLKQVVHKLYSKWAVLLFDLMAIPVAWCLAFWLRYNLNAFNVPIYTRSFYASLFILIGVQSGCYFHFKVYRGLWRFASLNDVVRILKAVLCAAVLVIPVYYLTSLLSTVPRSVLPLYSLLLSTLLCSARLLRRSYWDRSLQQRHNNAEQRVLIIGAGQAGASLVRDLLRLREYSLVGLIDDSPSKQGLEIHGIQVLGQVNDLERLVKALTIDLIFIALPSASSSTMRHIVAHCDLCCIPYRTLPSIKDLVSGHVEVNALRDVRIDDLLGRDQVKLNWQRIASVIENKRVLVTGGGGSIGSELCRQLLTLHPAALMIVDSSEYNLYAIDLELKQTFPFTSVQLALINITDQVAVSHLFSTFKPNIVFHAAAYKHVPLLEHQIRTAVSNNIIGTQQLCEVSAAQGVEKFIFISTDKAVNPTNVMGASKRVAEVFCQNLNARVSTQFITVRFGNVLDSVGSVVPLFKKQLKAGGPLTVTHPDMERYFMTIPEASQLILQAMANGVGGEIYVLDMGEPIKISYLAKQMIRLAGKELGRDIQIKYIGLRPGEKLFEELFHDSEQLIQTDHEKLFKARFREVNWDQLTQTLQQIKSASSHHKPDELLRLILQLVPEFQPTREWQ